MDPNSENQRWSKWCFEIVPGGTKRPTFADVKFNAAKFGRKVFGSTGAMKVDDVFRDGRRLIIVTARVEGHPVHDPQFVASMQRLWTRWAEAGFGVGTTCTLTESKLEAGSRQDGTPRDQLVILEQPIRIPIGYCRCGKPGLFRAGQNRVVCSDHADEAEDYERLKTIRKEATLHKSTRCPTCKGTGSAWDTVTNTAARCRTCKGTGRR